MKSEKSAHSCLLSPDDTVGSFVVERFLGNGGFAEVYRARHRFLDSRFALKVMKACADDMSEEMKEARMLAGLDHPHIVRVTHADVVELPDGRHGYYAMDFMPSGSLTAYWKSFGTRFMPVGEVVRLVGQALSGLAFAHANNILHRDIKPDNILLKTETGRGMCARVSDFGLARSESFLGQLYSNCGTPAYMAPEVFRREGTSKQSDIWSAGVTLYQLLTDKWAYEHSGAVNERTPPCAPPSQINPAADARLDAIVARALRFRREERYANAGEMLAALDGWQSTPPTQSAKDMLAADDDSTVSSKDIAAAAGGAADASIPLSQGEAEKLEKEALDLAGRGRLIDAADRMEEAMRIWPELREHYAMEVQAWRNGITTR
ncbi:MAG: serine/threonine protein kinase [Opitutaceae bacterium]|jgi:serine/threonine-protein kinase|nr:serine/threonine protein kinase [Opitutaceae bacterium]